MKNIFSLFIVLIVGSSCSNGDLNIASFEFEENVNVCGKFTLYRYSTNGQREVLMVTLSDKQIKNDDETVLPVSVTATGPYTVTNRVFDNDAGSNYFCAAVPPFEPKVIKNWEGITGTILVENKPIYDEDEIEIIAWEHIIVLNDVVLKSGDESLILNDTYLFGTFETSI